MLDHNKIQRGIVIMNLYFLFAALLLLILAFAHARWGEKKVFPLIKEQFTGET